MPVKRWRSKTSRQRVHDPHQDQLASVVEYMQREGYSTIRLHRESGTQTWHVEATKYVEAE